jgi:hypothetical protein
MHYQRQVVAGHTAQISPPFPRHVSRIVIKEHAKRSSDDAISQLPAMLLEPCSQMLPPNPHAHGPDPTVFFWGCVFQPCLQDARGGTAPPLETVLGIRSMLRCYLSNLGLATAEPSHCGRRGRSKACLACYQHRSCFPESS